MRVEIAYCAPDLISVGVKIDECWGKLKAIYGRKFHADLFLDVEADDVDLITKFLFELVDDGLQRDAAYSVGGLEFEQDRFASPDHCLHFFGIIH